MLSLPSLFSLRFLPRLFRCPPSFVCLPSRLALQRVSRRGFSQAQRVEDMNSDPNSVPSSELRKLRTTSAVAEWMEENEKTENMDLRLEAIEHYAEVYAKECKHKTHSDVVMQFIQVKPQTPIHVISLIDSLTKMHITNSIYWNSIEYFVWRTRFLQGLNNLQFIEIIFKGFHNVSRLESISVEEVYESLEPVLESMLDSSQQVKQDSIQQRIKSLIEIFYWLVVNLEGTSNIHTKIMKNLMETLTLWSASEFAKLLYILAYK